MSVHADGLMRKAHAQMKNNYKETGLQKQIFKDKKGSLKISKRYKKYIIGKIVRDEKGNESFVYFPTPIEESVYAKENNVDMSMLFVVRDLIVVYLTDPSGQYSLDETLKIFVYSEEE
tara:strand:+ start:712 stop:1065 length:354 start_codon:yes stop_codon:yes gene_type:complete